MLAEQHLSTFLYVLFAGALISAILSTVDSCLLAAASLVSHNLVLPLKPTLTDRQKILTARVGVAVFGVLAYVIALYAGGIYELVATASAFGSAGIFVVGLFGLFSRLGGAPSAYAALVAGVVVWAAGEYWLEWSTPYIAAVVAALAAYLAAAALALRRATCRRGAGGAFELRCRHASIVTGGLLKMTRAAGLVVLFGAATLPVRDVGRRTRDAITSFTPVTDAMLKNPAAGRLAHVAAHAEPLGLQPARRRSTGATSRSSGSSGRGRSAHGVQEGTPLVHDGVMFFPNPSDITQAFDAATGDLIWEYRRPLPDDISDYIPFPSINRNLAIYGNLILDNGADDFAYALDARTGELAWETQILDYRTRRAAQLGADRRERQGHLGAQLRARGRPRGLRDHGVRREDRQGAVAHAHDPETRRARRRDAGATFRTRSAGTSASGWCRASIRS